MRTSETALIACVVLIFLVVGCGQTATNDNNSVSAPSPEPTGEIEHLGEGGGGEIKDEEPVRLVADLYKQHDAQKGPFFQKDRSRIDRYFTKELGDLVLRDAIAPVDEIGVFGADPLYDGQDLDLKNFVVGKAATDGEKATVTVTFENFGEKKKVVFSLALVGNAWKISDIRYDHGASLLAILKEAYGTAKTNAPPVKNVPGEFEGTYRVGETTCTVKSIRKGFEVRWAKGSGSEAFVFEGRDAKGYNFVAETKEGKYNVFTFSDESYNTGTFTRADGRVFPVARAR